MEIRLAVAKLAKYAVAESGDTVEVVERPRGGLSAVIVDVQGSGRGAKRTSHQLVTKAGGLIADGARDGAVVRAVHDFLFSARGGQVSATLCLVSADLDAQALIISRNTSTPVIVLSGGSPIILASDVAPIGVRRMIKPVIDQFPLTAGLVVLAMTDGIAGAGRHWNSPYPLEHAIDVMQSPAAVDPQAAADAILEQAILADRSRPAGDMAVVLMSITGEEVPHKTRRLSVSYPF